MRRLSLCGSLVVAAMAFTGSACGSDPVTPTTPTTPTAVTEAFTGTIGVNGAVTFPFVSSQAGSANATIRALEPDASITVAAGGAGEFAVGETVFQGADLDAATWRGTVYGWNKAASILTVRGISGAFSIDGVLSGVDSKAQWTAKELVTTVVGLAMGTWSGTTCSVVLINDIAGVGSLIAGAVQGQGSLCARVYDVGKLTGTATFTIEVTHF